jgi:hypothetical protein
MERVMADLLDTSVQGEHITSDTLPKRRTANDWSSTVAESATMFLWNVIQIIFYFCKS